MDLLKALKSKALRRTAAFSAVAVLALGVTQAKATNNVAVLGHISASVQGTLTVAETSAINFGNFAIACTTCTAGGDTITLTDEGTRTKTGTDITFLSGSAGIAAGTNLETGSQTPGFYTITNSDGITNVYVSFANAAGAIMDSNHPNNYATITGPAPDNQTFTVKSFTYEADSSAATGPNSSGYTALAGGGTDAYGQYVACGASCTIRVGATLSTNVTTKAYDPGQYTGTFYVMVSY